MPGTRSTWRASPRVSRELAGTPQHPWFDNRERALAVVPDHARGGPGANARHARTQPESTCHGIRQARPQPLAGDAADPEVSRASPVLSPPPWALPESKPDHSEPGYEKEYEWQPTEC